MTTKSSISQEAADAWRDFILQQIVSSLETNRDKILDDYEAVNRHGLSRADIEQHELLDFDISITLHRDRKKTYGLGLGFFKINLLR